MNSNSFRHSRRSARFFPRRKYRLFRHLPALFAIFIVLFTQPAMAQDIVITATVPAPLPTGPPVITSPVDQQRFSLPNIPVEGTCESNTAYIVIMRNDLVAGSTPCTGGVFTSSITLFSGTNRLQARSFSFTDGEGPSSSVITVYYDIPSPEIPTAPPLPQPPSVLIPGTSPPRSSLGSPSPASPFYITSIPYYAFDEPLGTWRWLFTVHGGTPPYKTSIQWGDGTTTYPAPDRNNAVAVEHIYDHPGTFTAVITATDSKGLETHFQFFAIAKVSQLKTSSQAPFLPVIMLLITLILVIVALLGIELLIMLIRQLIISRHSS